MLGSLHRRRLLDVLRTLAGTKQTYAVHADGDLFCGHDGLSVCGRLCLGLKQTFWLEWRPRDLRHEAALSSLAWNAWGSADSLKFHVW